MFIDSIFKKPNTASLAEMLDKFAVQELIEFERFCRDNSLWEQMHTCFAEDATVTVSWYQGDGHGFVEASRKMATKAPHKLNNTLVWLNGKRAAAVTMASIQSRKQLAKREYDLTSYVRFLYTAEKEMEEWKIVSMNCIYEKDCLVPAFPEVFEGRELEMGTRESYGALTLVLGSAGHDISKDLPGDDWPELIRELLQEKERWFLNQ